MQYMTRVARQRGLSLIELCTTVAIAGILASAAVPWFHEFNDGRAVDGLSWQLAADLRYARNEAVTRNQGVRVSFYESLTGRCYLVHTSERSDCQCDGGGPAQCDNGGVALKSVFQPASHSVQLAASVNTMLFDARNGSTLPGGTLCVVPSSGRESRQTVNATGRISSCSPTVPAGACEPC